MLARYLKKVLAAGSFCILLASWPQNSDGQTIFPGLKIDDEGDLTAVYSILTTFQVLLGDDLDFLDTDLDNSQLDFVFVSGHGYLMEQRVAAAAVDMFDARLANRITSLEAKTDTCFVQKIRVRPDHELTFAAHNSASESPESVFKCLTVAIWHHMGRSGALVPLSDWRTTISRLLAQKGAD